MAINLIRNSRVFFTTNVDSAGNVKAGAFKNDATPFTNTDTFEIQVLEGLTFTQNTTQDTVTLNETGDTPNRGQQSFNVALEPVDFSFSTYIRPYLKALAAGTSIAASYPNGGNVTCEERFLWNAFASSTPIAVNGTGFGTAGTTAWVETGTNAKLSLEASNKNQLQSFGLIIVFSDTAYVIDNCAMDSATIDFGIDQISTIQWAGKGTRIRSLAITAADPDASNDVALDGADLGTGSDKALGKNTAGRFITNKLSVLTLDSDIAGADVEYKLAITGGSLTLSNNISYITPANLGQVNIPITYYTGSRSITGTFNAYLRTGTGTTNKTSGQLLDDLLDNAATTVQPSYAITFDMGGTSGTFVRFKVPAAMIQIPTVNTEQVISTTINFTGQGYTGTKFDIEKNNELEISYSCIAV